MGIKKNVQIAAEITGVKASRLQAAAWLQQTERMTSADAVMQQVERLQQEAERLQQEAERLLAQEVRPVTVKAKRGVQAERGRVRVERNRQPVITAHKVLKLQHALAEMATRELLEDERGHARFERNTRWGNPSVFVAGYTGFYTHIYAKYIATVEGLMNFEDALFDGGVMPRGYVTPDEIVAITGRQLGK